MKKLIAILIGITLAIAWGNISLAQEKKPAEAAKPAETAKPAEPTKPAEAKKETPPKPVDFRMGGAVVALDVVARKITLKQDSVKKQRKLVFTVDQKAAKDLAGINVGDVVNIWVTDKTVTSINKVF